MTVLDYHDRSKHRLERYAPGPGYLDWANQPDPFRSYRGAPRLALPLGGDDPDTSFAQLRAGRLPPPAPLDLRHVGILFELSLGLSAWKEYRGVRWALRCNPSSGNLHPTEAYVITPSLPGLEAGVWHYLSRDHCLEQRARLAREPGPGLWVVLTSIHWREAWKYGMRAYRYCQHDCGHAIAAVAYGAACLGWQVRVAWQAGDAHIAALAGLDRDEDFAGAEAEAPDVLLGLGLPGQPRPDYRPLASCLEAARWQGRANRLSEQHVDWPDIERVAAAAAKPATAEADACPEAAPPRHDWPPAMNAANLIRRRRSAVDFDGRTVMDAPDFFRLLAALLPSAAPPWSAWCQPPRVHLALFVHRVAGLEPGLYCLVREAPARDRLREAMRPDWLWQPCGPEGLPLYLLLPHDLRQVAKLVSCHQDIAADSCFSLGMLACFDDVAREPWRYRRLFWECGLIGQVLYLEAEAAGLRGTGIGCFFDEEMHRLLGLADRRWQSLYHFTVGGPVEDGRLTTLPPYPTTRRDL